LSVGKELVISGTIIPGVIEEWQVIIDYDQELDSSNIEVGSVETSLGESSLLEETLNNR
jgi:hypothetical protein